MQLDEILKIQDGVITMRQARECGLSKDAVIRKVRSGQWEFQFKGVYQSTAHRRTHVTRFRAALLSAGKDAVAHGKSAAWWHGLSDTAPLRHSITIPTQRSIRHPGHDLRRRDLQSVDVEDVRGARVTAVELSVLEAGESVLMDQALQTRTSIAKLEDVYARNRNCAGAAEAGRLLQVAKSGGRSEAERLTHRILKAVPGWTAQVKVAGRYLDVGFEATKVGLEIDGWRWHKDSQRHSKDLQRHNALTLAGWTILRFDWHRLDGDPAGVLAEVTEAVRRLAS
ncbi:DUF559 domain-containing protein [Smaragdicoccus niigatensis]|uniref:DUF559 domain-containing protein n=1 Tax=Smaragdicoccus niigatensis TaxID=359359 RepID=UPI00037AA7FB|nr:DUF559 domain-containing protein [Smaragdicoccus niigatensis]